MIRSDFPRPEPSAMIFVRPSVDETPKVSQKGLIDSTGEVSDESEHDEKI